MNVVLQNVIDAVSLGSLYALVALGVALVFSVMGLVNFAHGQLIMVGAYVLVALGSWPFAMTVAVMFAVVALAALMMERVAFRPARGSNPATLLVTSFALGYLLENLAVLIVGPLPQGVSLPPFVSSFVEVGTLRISTLDVLTVVMTLALLLALAAFLKRTPMGIQMRAAAEDFRAAQLLGVRPNRVIAVAFGISGLLAAAAALIVVGHSGTASPSIGLQPVLIGFVAAVVGGLGSIPGAAVGGLALGCLGTGLEATLPPELRPYRDAMLFGLVILTLLIRPHGLFPSKGQYSRV